MRWNTRDVTEPTYTLGRRESDGAPELPVVSRVKPTVGSQLALFANYSYHAFITDREGYTLDLEADHHRHAEIENAIRDLKRRRAEPSTLRAFPGQRRLAGHAGDG